MNFISKSTTVNSYVEIRVHVMLHLGQYQTLIFFSTAILIKLKITSKHYIQWRS